MTKIKLFIIFAVLCCQAIGLEEDDDVLKDIQAIEDEEKMDTANPFSEDMVRTGPADEMDDLVQPELPQSDPSFVQEEESVLVLTEDNFDYVVEQSPTLLVEFYAPWCGHCKSLAPEYAAAAEELKKEDIVLGKVDATVQSELGQRFDVSGYPTLRFFKNGKDHPYEGPRTKDGIVAYMRNIGKNDWAPEPEAVVTLTNDDFDEVVNNEDVMMVEFYAPWCGHCKTLAPIYEKAAKQLKMADPPIMFAKVDASKEKELAERFQIKGFPILKIFKKGHAFDYDGDRNSPQDFIQAVTSYIGDGAKEIDNLAMLKKIAPIDEIMVVGFFETKEDAGIQAFKDVADEWRNEHKFGIIYDPEARKAYHLKPSSVVVFNPERFYTKFEPRLHIMAVDENTHAIEVKKFVESKIVSLVGHYAANSVRHYDTRRPLVTFFYTVSFTFEGRDATQLWRNKIAAIASKHRDMTFAVADDEDFGKLMNEYGLEDTSEDMNIGIIGKNNKKYGMMVEEFDEDDIHEFINKFKKGKLKPFIRTQRPPKKQGAVKVVVGSTFDKIVKDSKKDVLIELYAPWCGHCKSLEPIYNKLAKKLKSEKNLVIAKMDATANDAPEEFSASGFPTIYFAPANNKDKPVKYEGARDVEGFEKFLREKSTVAFGGPAKDEL